MVFGPEIPALLGTFVGIA